MEKDKIVVGLDIGTTKICAIVGRQNEYGKLEVLGMGKAVSDGVVRGIGDYGNCLGIPTVAGEVYFDESYQDNPLINAMSVGLVDTKHIASATTVRIKSGISRGAIANTPQ